MVILGIDPGLATVGYGVIEYSLKKEIKLLDFGIITTSKDSSFPCRLHFIANGISQLVDGFNPDAIAFEELFFNKNVKTAIQVAQARGAALLAAYSKNNNLYEYTPLQVKQAIVGYGRADKNQVQLMIKLLCHLNEIPKPDDAADAVAIAITHALCSSATSELFRIK